MYPLDPSILKAYKQSEKLALESDINDPDVQKNYHIHTTKWENMVKENPKRLSF